MLAATGLTLGVVFPTAAIAQSLNFSFKFTGNMSCMSPIPVSNGAISGSGTGVMNQDGSVTADVTQSLLIFSTTVRFDSRLGSGVTTAPGGTAQFSRSGRHKSRFIWNLPNNTLLVTVNVRGRSCTATFQANLRPGMS